jgi:PHD/YefM family antitoxin component YafN of YafNO toxin-antitoxin module
MTTKMIGVKEFRQNLSSLYKKARKNNWQFVVLNRNQPIFRVEPLNEKDVIIERLAQDIAEAREDVKAGRVYDFEDVCEELGL